MTLKRFSWMTLSAVFFLSLSSPGFSQDDVIEKRKKLMKANSAANKAIKKSFAKGEYAAVEGKAKEVVENMEKLADLFPKGSTSDKSRAKAEIWDKWDDFNKKLTSAKDAAQTLADAAATKDQQKTGEAFKAFGKVCGSCHKPYRAPRK